MKIFDMFKKNEDSQAVAQAKAYYAQLTSPEYQKYFRIEDASFLLAYKQKYRTLKKIS